jgi:hypothetical protein
MPTRSEAKRSTVRALERRLARLTAASKAERERHVRQVAALRRAADRRLTSMVKEIAALRHHEARAEGLGRLLAERDAALAAQAERIAHLETLLRSPTHLG